MLPTNFKKQAKKSNIFIFGYEKADFRGKKAVFGLRRRACLSVLTGKKGIQNSKFAHPSSPLRMKNVSDFPRSQTNRAGPESAGAYTESTGTGPELIQICYFNN